jgi:hypothetical protein
LIVPVKTVIYAQRNSIGRKCFAVEGVFGCHR